VWLGTVSLHHRLSRLYESSEHKEKTVFKMCHLGWGEGGEAWS